MPKMDTPDPGKGKGKKVESPKTSATQPPMIRLAHVPGAQGDNNLLGQRGVEALPEGRRPSLLISFFYIDGFLANQKRYCYRDWVLDSGAFSAHNSGHPIDLSEYIECCQKLMAEDPTLVEIFALDDIGDWRISKKNTERMWAEGIPAIPTFHFGEPWEELKEMAATYPKIALGGMVGQTVGPRDKWIGQCFSRVWPKRIHGFGLAGEKTVMSFPFHSVDATNWEIGPCLTGDSLVSTSTGLVPIATLVDREEPLTVNTHEAVAVAGCRAIRSGIKAVVQVTLKTKQKVRCTSNHQILTSRGWVEAGKLQTTDEVRIPDNQIRTPVMKESLVDEMLGWFVGDGWFTVQAPWKPSTISKGAGRITLGIMFAPDDLQAMDKLLPVWDEFVGKKYALCNINGVLHKGSEATGVIERFKALGFKPGRAITKELPTYILEAEPYRQLAFLRGLFSADGTVKTRAGLRASSCQIGLASSSRKLIEQVQIMLLEYGIQSHQEWSKPPGQENEQGQLSIGGLDAFRYMRVIGFNLSAKTEKFRFGKFTHKKKQYSKVMKVEPMGEEEVYDIQMPTQHQFLANGMVVHNCKFGRWASFKANISVRGSKQNLRCEVEHYLDLEQRARDRWKKEMVKLDALPDSPTIRLAVISSGREVNSGLIPTQPGEPCAASSARSATRRPTSSKPSKKPLLTEDATEEG
jgi:hypothetical protein